METNYLIPFGWAAMAAEPISILEEREEVLPMPAIEGHFSDHPGHSQVNMVTQRRAHSFDESVTLSLY